MFLIPFLAVTCLSESLEGNLNDKVNHSSFLRWETTSVPSLSQDLGGKDPTSRCKLLPIIVECDVYEKTCYYGILVDIYG